MSKSHHQPQRSIGSRRHFLRAGAAAAAVAAAASVPGRKAAGEPAAGRKAKKAKFHLGLASYTLRKFALEDTLAMTQRVGLKYICFKSFHLPLDATGEQIQAAVEKVHEAGLTLYGGGVISMKNEEQVHQAFQYASAAGMKTIIGVPAPQLLGLVEKKVRQFNIQVAIHNHGPGDRVYPTPLVAYERIKDLDPRIGLCVDIGHTVRYGEDLISCTRRCADRILDVHLKDVTEASAKGRPCPAGRGVIDLPAFLQTLIDTGFSGVASFEYEAEPNDPLPGLAESVGYVRGILAVIG